MKKIDGITVIALVVTIIILLILSGVTIAMLTGDNGLLEKTRDAIEEEEKSEELEIVNLAIFEKNMSELTYQQIFDKNQGKGNIEVTVDDTGLIQVEFNKSKRIYIIYENEKIEYIGMENELKNSAKIIATPESNEESMFEQKVKLSIYTKFVQDENINLSYGWTSSKDKIPSNYIQASLDGNKILRRVEIVSTETTEGEYYLHLKIKINDGEILKTYGPYNIKSHDTIISTKDEGSSKSAFLDSTTYYPDLTRGKIKKIIIKNTLEGKNLESENTWDISEKKDGKYIAWFTKDENGFYEVTIAGEGGVVANKNSSRLFASIGSNISEEVILEGAENIYTDLVNEVNQMFMDSKFKILDLSSWNASKFSYMGQQFMWSGMFLRCSRLETLKLNDWKPNKLIAMGSMFLGCESLKEIDLSSFDVSNVNDMGELFRDCKSLKTIKLGNWNMAKVSNTVRMFQNVPTTVLIKTNKETKEWINNQFPNYSNIEVES